MIKNNMQIFVKNRENCCIFYHAIITDDKNILQKFLNSKKLQINSKNIDIENRENATALHYASIIDQVKLTIKSVKVRADIDIKNRQNASALHYVAKTGQIKLTIKFIKIRANIDIINKHNCSVLHVIVKTNRHKFVEILLERKITDFNLSAHLKKRLKNVKSIVKYHQHKQKKIAKK